MHSAELVKQVSTQVFRVQQEDVCWCIDAPDFLGLQSIARGNPEVIEVDYNHGYVIVKMAPYPSLELGYVVIPHFPFPGCFLEGCSH